MSAKSIGQEEFTRAVTSIENGIKQSRDDNKENFRRVFDKLDDHSTRITRLETKQALDIKKTRRANFLTASGLVTVAAGVVEIAHKFQWLP
jgi:hypothetical protein